MTAQELCERCGEPVYRRYHPALRMCARHAREHLASLPPKACTPADLEATGDEGHLGLLVVLADSGWTISEQRGGNGRITIWAANGNGSYQHAESGETEADAALKLFKALYSDEPDAIACACAFWPPSAPPAPVAEIGARS